MSSGGPTTQPVPALTVRASPALATGTADNPESAAVSAPDLIVAAAREFDRLSREMNEAVDAVDPNTTDTIAPLPPTLADVQASCTELGAVYQRFIDDVTAHEWPSGVCPAIATVIDDFTVKVAAAGRCSRSTSVTEAANATVEIVGPVTVLVDINAVRLFLGLEAEGN